MKGRILIVDDERAIGLAIQRLLGGRGHDVETALSAEEALEKLGRAAYHLVVTDLTLPRLSGMDLLRSIRERTPDTAVIMITAHGSERAAVEAMKLGAADYLPKPFDNDELELVVGRVLEGVALRRDFRLLQEKVADAYRFERMIGQSAAMQRVLAVTNQDLEAKVKAGTFREDLYYRLNVVAVVLPSLRERPEDLPLLIEHFLGAAAARLGRGPKTLASAAYRALLAHEWKGNVRELEHAIEQAVVLASAAEIGLDDLPPAVRSAAPEESGERAGSFRDAKQQMIERFERQFIGEALERHQGNISRAADELGMYRQHLQTKLAEYGIDAEVYRRRGEKHER